MHIAASLAGRQNGIVSRTQLLAAGVPPGMIRRLIRDGFLHPLHRGVYAVGHLALAQYAREQAALLACGPGAVISGRSALYLWGILDQPPENVGVTVAGRHCRKRKGICLQLVDAIDARELRRRNGLPTVFPARALIEFAADADWNELGDAVAEARVRRLIRDGELEAAAASAGRRRGAARMRAFLRDEAEPAVTRSRIERSFRKLVRAAHLPQPRANARLAGYEVDFLWEDEREIDGWTFHGHRRAFERDRRKTLALEDAGYQVIRITWRQLEQEPLALIAHIARVLDRRSRVRH